jgi:Ca2+-transporting ATPase
MKQKPRRSSNSIFAEGMGVNVVYQGLLEGGITLAVFYAGSRMYSNEVAVTMAFVTLGLIQLTHSMNVRSTTKSIFQVGLFTNVYLLGAILLSALLQVVVVLVPFLNRIFRVTPLNMEQWLIVILSAIVIIPVVELVKVFQRLRRRV